MNKIISIYYPKAISTYINLFRRSHAIYHFISYNEDNVEKIIDSIDYKEQMHILVLDYATIEKHNLVLSKLSVHSSIYSILMLNKNDNVNEHILHEDFIKTILENDFSYMAFNKMLKSSIESLMKDYKLHHVKADEDNLIALQEEEIFLAERRLNILYEVGIALSYEKDVNKIINMILIKAKSITNSDAAGIWILENGQDGNDEKTHMRLKYSLNDSVEINSREFSIALDKTSISGYVASTGQYILIDDVDDLTGKEEYVFNRELDEKAGYKTISMMVVPLINHDEKVIGVLQLINRKNVRAVLPPDINEYKNYVIDYDLEILNLIQAFASQATIALENALLYKMLEDSFEAFVNAVIGTIEARDPTTSGHSYRVMIYTLVLAFAVNEISEGIYKDIHFDDDEIEELKYAALLHDIGKISIKENVLMKAKKLHPYQIDDIERRIARTKYTHANMLLRKIIAEDINYNVSSLEKEYMDRINELNGIMKDIHTLNEPNIFDSAVGQKLDEIANMHYENEDGSKEPILKEEEIYALQISRGSLTNEEREIINSHVVHTKNFLDIIPWTENLKNVPELAAKHHEFLDGSGYPNGCKGDEIPMRTRMMTIADIFDSLTATDRPYKKAVPMGKSFAILREEARRGKLDCSLVEIFIALFS